MTNPEIVSLLRDLAQEIEAGGRVEATTSAQSFGVNPVQPIKLEVQYNSLKGELEIQVKLKGTP